ncbi:hypothetical protein [Dyadobacter sp. Leaf189]|uniref:hypothetical protein n=1 Tax=Dyadobacter sp. Leaf189 TaxID=1736295 RepID=UPI0006FB5B15|nr:hypothetical protein [Dyadobacter sp. Leaf189]KQS33305.1 hypothetical protein ASG33_04275 [Dyadobacter sp. Leaf189]
MKSYVLIVCVLLAAILYVPKANAQKSKKGDSFPTYEQIRGDRREIFDHVAPVQVVDQNVAGETGKLHVPVTLRRFDAFGYPPDSTIYYLNGRKIKSQKAAEAELREKAGNVERVSIGEVDKKGMRVIEIDYELKKQ